MSAYIQQIMLVTTNGSFIGFRYTKSSRSHQDLSIIKYNLQVIFSGNCMKNRIFSQESLKYFNFKNWMWIQKSLKSSPKLKFTKPVLKLQNRKNKNETFFYQILSKNTHLVFLQLCRQRILDAHFFTVLREMNLFTISDNKDAPTLEGISLHFCNSQSLGYFSYCIAGFGQSIIIVIFWPYCFHLSEKFFSFYTARRNKVFFNYYDFVVWACFL